MKDLRWIAGLVPGWVGWHNINGGDETKAIFDKLRLHSSIVRLLWVFREWRQTESSLGIVVHDFEEVAPSMFSEYSKR